MLGLVSFFVALASFLIELGVLLMLEEEIFFYASQVVHEYINVGEVEFARAFAKVTAHRGEEVFVDEHQSVESSFTDAQGWQVGQEIVPNKETEEHEVVHDALKVEGEGELDIFEL